MPTAPALAGRAVGVGRVRRAAGGDRRAQRIGDVGERRLGDPAGRVELEDRRAAPPSKWPTKVSRLIPDLLLPRDVGHVAGERDVGPGGVVDRVRDGLAAVEELEVIAADQPRHEDRRACRRRCPPPTRPRARSVPPGVSVPGRDARVLGVVPRDLVQRARVLGRLRLGAGAEAVRRAGRVEDVRLAGRAVADGDPLEAAVGRRVSATTFAANTIWLLRRPGGPSGPPRTRPSRRRCRSRR